MNYRALGKFGLAFALSLVSSRAFAQEDEEVTEAPATPKPAAPPEDAAAPAAVSSKVDAAVSTAPTGGGEAKATSADAHGAVEATPAAAADEAGAAQRPPVYGKRGDWFIQPYGYARLDAIVDSTQSFDDGINPNLIQRPGTYRGDHRRSIFTARDSRLGVFVGAPAFEGIKTSAQIELDFYGLQVSDAKKHDQVVFGPVRIRHAYVKIETSVVDVVAGQYYDLFGWGSYFYPATVAYLGVPGQIYHRNPQLRVEKKLKAGGLEIMGAIAAVRPGQRDAAGIPDGQAGLKVAYGGWSGVATPGFGRPVLTPISLGVSGTLRHFEVPAFRPEPGSEAKTTNGYGIAAQALLPVLPASSLEDKGNSLTFTGEFSIGSGIADLYTGMDGGSRFPLLPNPSMSDPALVYPQNVDPGLVTFDRASKIKSINWKGLVVGGQYYFPFGNGRLWLSGIYSRVWSDNIKELTPAANWGGIFTKMEYIDGNIGFDVTPAVAVGLSFQTVKQTFGDVSAPTPNYGTVAVPGQLGVTAGIPGTGGVPASARNNRGQLSVALFF